MGQTITWIGASLYFLTPRKADLAKVPVSTKRIWMRVADPSSSRRKLCPDSIDVLRFFKHHSSVEWRPRPLRPPALVAVETAADAFGKGNQCGIGGWLRFPSGRTIWFSQLFEVQQFTALGIPVQSDANLDISSYETLAQCFVLLAFWKCSGAGRLALKLPALSDNSGAEAVCNKLYTSKIPLNLFVRKLCMWSALAGISLECSHIAGEKNDDADFLSRWNGEVSVLHAPVQGCSSRTRGKAAGNRGSFVEAGGGKDLAEQGLVAINIGGAGEGKTKETGTERSGGREGEQGGPTGCEGSNGCRPQRSRHSTGPAASEEANELGGLGTPAATNLKCKDNKSAPLRAHQLWIGAFLSPACEAKSGALVLALVPARSATSIERGNQGGIDSKLRAAPERESIGDDLDAAIIEAIGVDVEVAHKNIAGNCSPSLSADTGSSTLEREPTGAQDARTGASSAVVTERVDRTAAATSCSVERQGQAKPAEQQSTENRRVQGELVAGRQGGEDPRGERSTLRPTVIINTLRFASAANFSTCSCT
ncbi:hypothetical protein AK812_SmicGene22018 [Symbiodinium microadriaticum]|uniref:Uncharacterized protein n=1 Tax=Symbiodinium microadriaticum TaxID=2951 RepID=A0A1Q9DKV8_SYMMI|nr:hypothetical protein AK812_SmicGene22018 [Symbiodinium microadriaticum]